MPEDYQADERDEQSSVAVSKADEKLLAEIRKNYRYASDTWKDIREEARKDMKYVSGDPWDEKEKAARKDAQRPCLTMDELNQYLNQVINDVRQNKRAIKFTAEGAGANDQLAELRQNITRAVEYKNSAQMAYITAFENALQRSYGFFRIGTRYVKSGSFHQELTILPIPNPDTVLMDPDCKMPDRSDAEFCFVTDVMRKADFKRKYPKAQKTSFSTDDKRSASEWIRQNDITVAEYWKREKTYKKLHLLKDGKTVYADAYDGDAKNIDETREDEVCKVCQYITNGIEILERNEFPGDYIPIIMVSGKEMYVDNGSGAERVLMSLIRLARDPYMLYCYYRTCQMELVGMVPKTPYVGFKGQFDGMEDIWASINQVPRAYIEANLTTEQSNGQPLPPPQRATFEPAIQALEVGAEASRRAIQAACGINPLPTAAQRQNEKSGKALNRIQQTEAQGSFHFVDNFDRALCHAGRVINQLIPIIYREEGRDLGIRKADDTHAAIKINDKAYVNPKTQQPEFHDTQSGEFDVTISTGPSDQSQREEVNDFVGTLVQNIQNLPLDPAVKSKLISLFVKLKNMGSVGDQIAQLLDPQADGQQMQASLMQSKQQVQALDAAVQALQGELKKMQSEKDAKVLDNQLQFEKAKLDAKVKIVIAEIGTKAQIAREREAMLADAESQLHAESHEAALEAAGAGHEAGMAAQGHQQNTELADQNAANSQIAAQQAAEQQQPAQ